MSAESLEKGRVVGGRYRLESVLGHGGMAVVWRAEHTETGRNVALKVVRPELAAHQSVRDMFVREARVAARIGQSEHIVDVLDAGVDSDVGLPFLAMELLSGETLDERLRRSGPPPRDEALSMLQHLAEALDQAHAAGVIHRDLKPGNLFLTQNRKGHPTLKVLDFGIAKAAETVQSSATQVGTPAYAAPEQLGASWRTIAARNGRQVAAQVSQATDVWALGLVAYEIFTGAPSGQFWGAQTLAELPAKVFLEPLPSALTRAGPAATRLPPGFEAWLGKCLQLDAAQRFAGAGEAIAALLAGAGIVAQAGPAAQHLLTPAVGVQAPAAAQHLMTPAGPAQAPTAAAAMDAARHSSPPAATGLGAATTLGTWAAKMNMQLRDGGDVQTYLNWMQFQFVPPIHKVVREGRVQVGDADILVGEVVIQDELRQAVGEAHMLIAIIGHGRIHHNVAVKAKKLTSLGEGLSRGLQVLDSFVMAKPKDAPVLGDQWFESKFEVRAPSPQEAALALPTAARQFLVNSGFTGIMETRPGRVTLTQEPARFDITSVDRLLETTHKLLDTFP